MARKRRGKTQILAEILREAEGGERKTRIIRSANTNHVRGTEYIEHCLEAGLLVERDDLYRVTEKGQRLLRHWEEVAERLPGN